MTKEQQMAVLTAELVESTEAPLYEYRTEHQYKLVVGEGRLDAEIMFIGEAPGENEALAGRPFVGASGRMLNTLLNTVSMSRENIYITNIVKDRPPENRGPLKAEIAFYGPYLERQIAIIQPRVIVTLGRFAMEYVLNLFAMPEKGQKIGALHGQKLYAHAPYGPITVIPLYHPAVALYNEEQRQTLIDDFQALKDEIIAQR